VLCHVSVIPITQEAEAGGSKVPCQPALHSKNLPQKAKQIIKYTLHAKHKAYYQRALKEVT
jgi:hypothetical protein